MHPRRALLRTASWVGGASAATSLLVLALTGSTAALVAFFAALTLASVEPALTLLAERVPRGSVRLTPAGASLVAGLDATITSAAELAASTEGVLEHAATELTATLLGERARVSPP
jgi:hypothetical protein